MRNRSPRSSYLLLPGLVGLVMLALLSVSCHTTPKATALRRFEYREPHMGTMFYMTLYAPNEEIALPAAKAAFKKVIELNEVMSDYDPDSEVMQFCRQPVGVPIKVSRDLFEAFQVGQQAAVWSDGDFDITIGPVIQLWRKARKQGALPAPTEIEDAKRSVGYRYLKLDERQQTAMMMTTNMLIDLGGIGKGIAADKALNVLRQHGITRAMVAASGDIAIGDAPPGREGWTIGIGSIDATNSAPNMAVILKNAGISTSGDTEQFVEINGVRYSHIVNPATGIGLTNRVGVTVIAPNSTITDSLDTTLSIMGEKRALALVEKLPDVSCRIVTIEGERKEVTVSPRFHKLKLKQLTSEPLP